MTYRVEVRGPENVFDARQEYPWRPMRGRYRSLDAARRIAWRVANRTGWPVRVVDDAGHVVIDCQEESAADPRVLAVAEILGLLTPPGPTKKNHPRPRQKPGG